MQKKMLLAVFVALSGIMPNGWCVVPQKATLAELVNQADAVVIVKDVRHLPIEKGDGDYYFRVSALTVMSLKGDLPEDGMLTVRIDDTIPERSPVCCEGNTSYLMFLSRNENHELAPIRVVNSVLRLGKLD